MPKYNHQCFTVINIAIVLFAGQNRQYFTKALLIYDGIHYDPLVCHTATGEVTMFTVDDEQVAALALNMAREAQQVTISIMHYYFTPAIGETVY